MAYHIIVEELNTLPPNINLIVLIQYLLSNTVIN